MLPFVFHFSLIITKSLTGCYNYVMAYYLSRRAALKWLETPSVYNIAKDELYELDSESFRFMKNCMAAEGCESKSGAFIDYCLDEGILTSEKVSLSRPRLLHAPVPSLRYLELHINDACNLRCRHCYISDPAGQQLSSAEVLRLLGEFQEMQGLGVLISGGEPLLHSEFDSINETLPDFFLRKVLFTNGLLLGKERLRSLKVDEIRVSIDGLETAHDAIRGTGMFRRTMDSVRLALDAGFDVSVSTMIHRFNLADFDVMEHLFKKMGIKDWAVDVPCRSGRLNEHPEILVGPKEGGRLLGYGFGAGLHASGHGSECGLHLLTVLADGRFARCAFYADRPLGTIDQGLLPAWEKRDPVLLADLFCDCEYREVCRGGCRYRAELAEGKGGKDLYRCTLYGIIK